MPDKVQNSQTMYKNWFHASRAIQSDQKYKKGGKHSENEKDILENVSMEKTGLEPHIFSPRGKEEFVIPHLN